MIVTAIFKAMAFYLLFITIRGAIRAYGNYSKIKDQMSEAKKNYQQGGFSQNQQQSQQNNTHGGADIIEADYKVLD